MLVFTLVAQPTWAQESQSDVEERLETLRNQISMEENRLEEITAEERDLERTLRSYQRQIAQREELVDTYQRQVNYLNSVADSLTLSIAQLEVEIDVLRAEYQARAVHAYRFGRLHDLALILSSNSINQMLVRVQYLNRFTKQRRAKYDGIQERSASLDARREALDSNRRETQKLLAETQSEQAELQTLYQRQNETVGAIRSEISSSRRTITAMQAEEQELVNQIRAIMAASSNRTRTVAEEAAYNNLSASFTQNKGRFPWPVQGAISEPFGDVVNPATGTRTPNPGIVITTTPQAEVRSIFDGRVSKVDVMLGFGTVVFVEHGSYSTVYGNLSMTYVAEGQEIKAGHTVGRSGTPTQPKGAALFFGLFSKGGQQTNPVPWLRGR
ncbi:MAG: peptidoglycan DD-metalloendopeptidase family protein [Rhodothermales bacterium]